MTPKALAELLEYAYKNNGWGVNMYENRHLRHRRCFKYIDVSFDTRDGAVWRILFREGGGTSGKTFRIESAADIKEVYAFLDEQID